MATGTSMARGGSARICKVGGESGTAVYREAPSPRPFNQTTPIFIFFRDWMRRHVYFQSMQDAKFSSRLAMASVFVLSAVWHEWILVVAMRQVRPILSSLIVAQVGLVAVTNTPLFANTRLGNAVIWVGPYSLLHFPPRSYHQHHHFTTPVNYECTPLLTQQLTKQTPPNPSSCLL
eukprot:TRINITY_DN1225_c0_g1_i3.p1 TRINITY_DN1225_c0_g1~~TRINITY_DN1225_c0_g1_i3.p1  ORF type:complete len:176 (+),score=26.36 TRINITY_DN1225_c0_g1_i3:89-616(+)